jgi:hypothetical protein
MHLLLWDVTQRRVVLVTEVSGQPWPLKKGLVGCPETSITSTNLRCVTSEKSEDLNYTASEAPNLAGGEGIEKKLYLRTLYCVRSTVYY